MEEKNAARTFWISGPRWAPDVYFEHHYRSAIDNLIRDPEMRFILGDGEGAERWAQKYLAQLGAGPERVTVFIRARDKASEWARMFAVDDQSENEAERNRRMTTHARHTLCFIPQFGTLVPTSGVAPLEANYANARRTSPLRRFSDTILAHSEPHDPRFEIVQRMLYFLWYSPQRELTKPMVDALVETVRRNRPAARGMYAPHSD